MMSTSQKEGKTWSLHQKGLQARVLDRKGKGSTSQLLCFLRTTQGIRLLGGDPLLGETWW